MISALPKPDRPTFNPDLPRLTYCILWVGSGWDMAVVTIWCGAAVYDLTGALGDPSWFAALIHRACGVLTGRIDRLGWRHGWR